MDMELMQSFRRARRLGGTGWHPVRVPIPAATLPSIQPLPADAWHWDDNDGLVMP